MNQSQKISLPDITLVLIDNIAHELAQRAIEDTLDLIEPAEVLLWTNDVKALNVPGAMYYPFLESNILGYNHVLWQEVPLCVYTSHLLVIQWDGWTINPLAWSDEFLNYDYIGAVWPWHKENRVGNGGFSLRSTKLMQFISSHLHPGKLEDDTLCRVYINLQDKFSWANETTADRFSREHNWTGLEPVRDKYGYDRIEHSHFPFGFHDCRNWPRVLSREQLLERSDMCERNPYIKQKQEYKDLIASTMYSSISPMEKHDVE